MANHTPGGNAAHPIHIPSSSAPSGSPHRWKVLWAAFLSYFFNSFDLTVLAIVMPVMLKALALTLPEGGLLGTATMLGAMLGSILFGVLISKVMYNDDVRNHGSGNAGMTNVLRTYGKLPAVFTTLGDVGKSVAAVNLGRFIFGALLSGTGAAWQNPLDPVCGAYLAAIFCMIGHSRPIFFGFKGGKGVLVGAGAALATEPLVCAVLLAIFLIEVAVTRIVSLGSIIIAALYPVGTLINLIARGANLPTILFSTICCVIMAAMVIWLHRSNIERLKNGTEYRFGQKK